MQYVKIKDSIVEQIESGLLSPRQKLPAERKLSESFDTTRVTLREALSLLEAEGRIYREDRRGWFISPEPLKYDPTQTLNFTNMALAQNRSPQTELIAAKGILANKQAASLLGLQPFSDVYKVDRVRYLEDRPVVFVTNYIRPELFPNLLDFDLSKSLTDIYRDHFGMVYQKIRYRISTSSLLGDTAQALRATSGTPAMVVERINYNQHGELIDCDIEYWRHDAISIESIAVLNH
ncbi:MULTISPECIES: phosphonate utilization transcriptional regulator PhnR [Vibrio]|uniref:Phosphonate utilization transcriptional regulator PhnR n=1 Tax=Vibrio coralliilyticus TaxID=190893 RepID=A0AAP7DD87_9VIBR|nr:MULTISPECIES: phosphonate utilization transcriptional regulator PhnR [Vibrio]MCM5508394.1 phosphonate utilization transcriptional regulator PhnR [Vibrio sp. SCSIO 43169]AIS56947.1 GntR family transcriptional regulator [Vibrio coralliilyticus]ARC93535.1 phosphonate utilization transcriptional regulator PhnR [Vibrio coralliilyticus]EEX33358.1 2-aminoethylphosphonate uptake and metabolism regulator [Vibrio coralliilyticus ATCC BAA-450]ERB67096.1 GntR family transcriptional regulator [Vibrio co